ncbi:pentatricopeptide repeat-containing protein At4g38150-like isoform X1 [Zingiber officinale]|nr:pentatricopeptide repeat-containing protein At4g38150-like isoform X1 [Zingiber officinale]
MAIAAAAAIPRSLLSLSSSSHWRFLFSASSSLLRLRRSKFTSAFFVPSLAGRRCETALPVVSVFLPSPRLPSVSTDARCFCSSSRSSNTNSTASFGWSDDEDENKASTKIKEVDKSKLPPPYDPFSKKPAVEEPRDPSDLQEIFHKMRTEGLAHEALQLFAIIKEPWDPSDLQEIFHKMRTEGLTNYAIKMFDGLSKDGLAHEALQLFAIIKDKGTMPDVVAHTAVLEAYANAGGHSKEAIRTYDRMLASGVCPNAYTFAVLVKGLAKDGRLPEARKYLLEMMGKGMRPNAGTYLELFEAYLREQKGDEARALVEEMRGKGFVPEGKAVRETIGKRSQVYRAVMDLFFGK